MDKMSGAGEVLRQLIQEAVEVCSDLDLLDLILKLLTYSQ